MKPRKCIKCAEKKSHAHTQTMILRANGHTLATQLHVCSAVMQVLRHVYSNNPKPPDYVALFSETHAFLRYSKTCMYFAMSQHVSGIITGIEWKIKGGHSLGAQIYTDHL